VFGNLFTQVSPVHLRSARDFDFHAAFVFEHIDGVLWQKSSVPLRAFVAGVGAGLCSKIAGGIVGVVGNGFHKLVIKINGGWGGEGEVLFVERVLQSHDTEADRAVAGVRGLRGGRRVEVNIDDVIECADGDGDRLLKHFVIE